MLPMGSVDGGPVLLSRRELKILLLLQGIMGWFFKDKWLNSNDFFLNLILKYLTLNSPITVGIGGH